MKTTFDENAAVYPEERTAIDQAATALLNIADDDTMRADAARIVRQFGLVTFVGGHHVAIHAHRPGPVISRRLAMVTHEGWDWQ